MWVDDATKTSQREPLRRRSVWRHNYSRTDTANTQTKNLDFRGLDTSILLILRGEFLGSWADSEILTLWSGRAPRRLLQTWTSRPWGGDAGWWSSRSADTWLVLSSSKRSRLARKIRTWGRLGFNPRLDGRPFCVCLVNFECLYRLTLVYLIVVFVFPWLDGRLKVSIAPPSPAVTKLCPERTARQRRQTRQLQTSKSPLQNLLTNRRPLVGVSL